MGLHIHTHTWGRPKHHDITCGKALHLNSNIITIIVSTFLFFFFLSGVFSFFFCRSRAGMQARKQANRCARTLSRCLAVSLAPCLAVSLVSVSMSVLGFGSGNKVKVEERLKH